MLLIAGIANATTIELTTKNTVLLRNEVNEVTITKLQKDLAGSVTERGAGDYTIYIVLDTPGGSIDSGLMFIEFAKAYKNVETITVFAASMGSAIVQALPGKRNILETGVLMFHRAAGGVQGQFEDGELESQLNFYKKIVRGMEQKNADRMGMLLKSYKEQVKDELWILGSNSIQQKAADAVVTVQCTKELIDSKLTETFSFMGMFVVQVEFSACPLVRGGKVIIPENENNYKKYRADMKWKL